MLIVAMLIIVDLGLHKLTLTLFSTEKLSISLQQFSWYFDGYKSGEVMGMSVAPIPYPNGTTGNFPVLKYYFDEKINVLTPFKPIRYFVS